MSRSKENKAQFIQQLRDAVNALEANAPAIPSTLLDSFSPKNCLAILAQKPSATHCAGFHAWREAGRQVRKGAKGLAIFIPLSTGDDSDTVKFTWRYVFDISDTQEITPNSPATLRELVNA